MEDRSLTSQLLCLQLSILAASILTVKKGQPVGQWLFPPAYLASLTMILWIFHRWHDSPFVTGASVLFGLWGILNFGGAILVAWMSSLVWENVSEVMRKMRKYRAHSTSPILYLSPWLGYCGSIILAQSLLIEIEWLGIALAMLGVATFNYSRFVQPPFALVLGLSKSGRDIARIAAIAARPYQISHLMEWGKNRDMYDGYARSTNRRIDTDNLLSWRQEVSELSEIAKIIILDTRNMSAAVEEELNIIDSAGFLHKTILVVDSEQASLPANFPETLRPRVRCQCKIVECQQLPVILTKLTKHSKLLPTIQEPIASFGSYLDSHPLSKP